MAVFASSLTCRLFFLVAALFVGESFEALTALANVNEEVEPPHEIINLAMDRQFSRYATKTAVFGILGDPSSTSQSSSSSADVLQQDQQQQDVVNFARLLSIDPSTGIVRVAGRIDREQLCPGKNVNPCSKSVDVSIRRNDSASPVSSGDMIVGTLTVHIFDVNDNAPAFSRPSEAIAVSESARVGDVVATFRASDSDFGDNSVKGFQIIDATETFDVKQSPIDTSEVLVLLKKPLDREMTEFYHFQIRAFDGSGLESLLNVNVSVADDNDNSPEFTKPVYNAELVENRSYKDPFVVVKANDRDDGVNSQIFYKIDDADAMAKQYFYIHHSNGGISALLPLDYELTKDFRFKVLAVDNLGRGRTSTATVAVSVADVNDNPPTITVKPIGEQYIDGNGRSGPILVENYDPNGDKPKALALIIVRDPDTGEGGEVACSINSTDFALELMYAKTYRLIPKRAFDREKTQEVPVEVSCSDKGRGTNGGPLAGTKTTIIRIGDVNDNAPTFFHRTQSSSVPVFAVNISENNPPGYIVAELVAEDMDVGDNGKLVYELRPDSISEYFDILTTENRGLLKAKHSFDYEKIRKLSFEILAIDRGQPRLTGSTSFEVNVINVNDNLPAFQRPSYVFFARDGTKNGAKLGQPIVAIDADEELVVEGRNITTVRYYLGADDNVKKLLRMDEITGQLSVIAPEIVANQFEPTNGRIAFSLLASDSQNRAAFTRVPASLHVVPIDQTGPVVLFPNIKNDTVIMATPIPAKTAISRIIAYDVEDGTNLVTFTILSIDPPLSDLVIDSKTGIISINEELVAIESVLYEITVSVRTQSGETATTVLKLFVSPDKNAIEAFAKTAFVRDSRNLTIVIILCCASGAISVIIITIIVLVKRRDRNNRTYNARKAAEKKLKELGFEAASPPAGDQNSLARNMTTANGTGDTSMMTPTSGHRLQSSIDNDPHMRNSSPSDHSSSTVNTTASLVHNQQSNTPAIETDSQHHGTLQRNGNVKFQLQPPQQQISPANSSDGEGSAATATSGLSGSDKHTNEYGEQVNGERVPCPVHSQKTPLTVVAAMPIPQQSNRGQTAGLLQPHADHHMSNERLRAFFADPHHQQILSTRMIPQPPPPPSFLLNGNGTCVERARIVQTSTESPQQQPRVQTVRRESDGTPRQVTWAQVTNEVGTPLSGRSSSVVSSNAPIVYAVKHQQQPFMQPSSYDPRQFLQSGYATMPAQNSSQSNHDGQMPQQSSYPSSTLVIKSALRTSNSTNNANCSPSMDSLTRPRSVAQGPPSLHHPQQVTFATQSFNGNNNNQSSTSNSHLPSTTPGVPPKVQLSDELLRTQNLEMVV